MTPGTLLFAVCALLCVAGALATALARNPVRGAMGLLGTIAGIAGLFLKLSAEFLAAIQLIVYAGAVVVLFVFVLMLLGPAAARAPVRGGRAKFFRFTSCVLVLGSGLWALRAFTLGDAPRPLGAVSPTHGSAEAVGRLLFGEALVPFELTTALLIVAVVGAIAVARGRQGIKRPRPALTSPRDLFTGPLMSRDAERPLNREAPAE